jgi:hypothetical protein
MENNEDHAQLCTSENMLIENEQNVHHREQGFFFFFLPARETPETWARCGHFSRGFFQEYNRAQLQT